jgi:hypothetical protein
MKKNIVLFCIAALLASCTPGKWVAGNAKHFQQRQEVRDGNVDNVGNVTKK